MERRAGAGATGEAPDLESLLRQVVDAGASDLHLTAGAPPMVRVDGRLQPLAAQRLTAADTQVLLERLAGPEARERLARAGQVEFSHSVPGLARFRVGAYRQRGAVSLVLRAIPGRPPGLDELGLPPALGELALRPHGLVLVAGAAGAGKSTTLAAMVRHINERAALHVITLEDPIEYLFTHDRSLVEQREVGHDAPDVASGLRAAMRQGADVIVVGELDDGATAALALVAAETGHLVLAAVRASGVVQAVERLLELFAPEQRDAARVQLAGVLQGVLAQQLVPRCDRPGRVAAVELLLSNPAARSLIKEGKLHQLRSVVHTGARQGMVSMERSLEQLFERGVIAEQEYRERMADLGMPPAAGGGRG